VDVN